MSNKLDNSVLLDGAEGGPGSAIAEGSLLWGDANGVNRCGMFTGKNDPNMIPGAAWVAAGLATGGSAVFIRQDAVSAITVLYVTFNGGTSWTALS